MWLHLFGPGRGRGAAVLSTALNSNTINVVAGLLIPASLAGLAAFGAGDTGLHLTSALP